MDRANYVTRRHRLIHAFVLAMDASEWERTDAIRRAFWRLQDTYRPVTRRYREYPNGIRMDLVMCRDCSTRARIVLIPRDEITEHNAWHEEAEKDA